MFTGNAEKNNLEHSSILLQNQCFSDLSHSVTYLHTILKRSDCGTFRECVGTDTEKLTTLLASC